MDHPNLLSVVPPLLALVMAIATRNVLVSLGVGVFLGMTIVDGFNPLAGAVDFFEKGVLAQLGQGANAEVVVLIMAIGGFVHLLERSGGMVSFARQMTRVIDSPLKAQLSVWVTGMAIFFTDSGNSLILGPMFRPIFAGARVCREKLAFIIDSTSSPVCVMVPVISWGVYIMSLLDAAFTKLQLDQEPLDACLRALPFQLYPMLALLTVPVLALTGREWGPMLKAQRRFAARREEDEPEAAQEPDGPRASARAVLVPLASMLLVLFALFGIFMVRLGSLPGAKVRLSLLLAYLTAAAVCAIFLSHEKVQDYARSFQVFLRGTGKMVFIVVILLLAWSLGDVCELLGTGRYVAGFFDRGLDLHLLPAIVFVLGAVFSLSTGSSWGTFALLMPIAVPVAHEAGAPLFVTIAAVLSGGVFGDHCSPVSDTTILSSMATGCDHADHVNTQLMYASVTGLSALVGFVIAGFTGAVWVLAPAFALQVVLTLGVTRLLGERVGADAASNANRVTHG